MIKELMHDPIFLAGKSEVATKDDLQVAQDLLDTLMAHRESCVGSVSIDNGQVYTFNHWLEEGEQITIDLTKGQTFFGSMVLSGSVWIIVGIAVALAAAAIITVIVVKKRKKISG